VFSRSNLTAEDCLW